MEHLSFLRRWRTVLASTIGFSLFLSAGSASAALTSYTDVESGAYYEQAAADLLSKGALDASQSRLRPGDLATRAEVFKMLVDLNDKQLQYPSTSSFSDVSRSAWYFPYIEAAAKAGWIKGDNNCYGQGLSKCTARPNDHVNRAEMTILLQRAFALPYLGAAPVFADVQIGQWYFNPIQTAADHCILQGDANTGLARPASFMNRAEMVVMFDRASQDLQYGQDCGLQPEPTGSISSVNVTSSDTVRVTFNVDLNPNIEDDIGRYVLEQSNNGADIGISALKVINARIVELSLDTDLSAGVSYRLSVQGMRTAGGSTFSDNQTFTSNQGAAAAIDSVTVRSNNMLRVRFTTDVSAGRADDAFRYSLERASNGVDIGIGSASIVDSRTVDLSLTGALLSDTSYRLRVQDLTTTGGTSFSDDITFTSTASSSPVSLDSVTATSSNHLRLQFSGPLNKSSAEDESHYTFTGVSGELGVTAATLTSSGSVDLALATTLQSQQSYTVSVNGLQGANGVLFNGTKTFTYGASNVQFSAALNGSNEVPSTGSSATGTGSFTLTSSGLQYDITVRGFGSGTITGAHFHRGAVGVSGPVVQSISFNGSHATGTWTGLTQQDRDDLLNGRIYVNVHTAAFPDGEIRGQVLRP